MTAHDPVTLSVPTAPARGVCEVVVFTQDPAASLGTLPLWHVELLLEVWADRYRELGALADVEYVYPFENRGVEVRVTLNHPHGQIYAYPFVPPKRRWGWRHFAFAVARLGYRITMFEGNFPCPPPGHRDEDEDDRVHRDRQWRENLGAGARAGNPAPPQTFRLRRRTVSERWTGLASSSPTGLRSRSASN